MKIFIRIKKRYTLKIETLLLFINSIINIYLT